jgi:5'(3')-deoxyribonucleotidase
MGKQVIAIDLDDVVVETAPNVIEYYAQTYGTRVPLEKFYSKDYENVWGAPDGVTAVKRVNEFLESPKYYNSAPIREAIETIRWLKQRYELHIVTGRPNLVEQATHRWLKKHFPDVFETVVFTNYFMSGSKVKIQTKGDICQELGATVLIDDNLEHILSVTKAGVDGLLFGSYPWNQAESLPENVKRVEDWKAVKEYFDGRG